MAEAAILFDPANPEKQSLEEVQVLDWTVINGFYIQTSRGLMAKAYIYPARHRAKLAELFDEYKTAKATFEAVTARIFYQELPKLT